MSKKFLTSLVIIILIIIIFLVTTRQIKNHDQQPSQTSEQEKRFVSKDGVKYAILNLAT